MTEVRGYEVGEREASGEHELSPDHTELEHWARSPQLEEGHQVHPLVLRLLDQSVDPAVVPLHLPQRLQVTNHPRSEAWHPSHRLQEDAASQHRLLVQRVQLLLHLVPGQQVEAEPHHADTGIRCPVHHTLGSTMIDLNILSLLLAPDGMRKSVVFNPPETQAEGSSLKISKFYLPVKCFRFSAFSAYC